ncbi:MAG: nucleoside triphosphate pyrophosphohydrolase family protein [Candidatus Liptonbacteria bacterium]|nr:nucleoside triphosphate pyrophosphohydrolase family protein [Candidatus Liptonbacteria bacterium]
MTFDEYQKLTKETAIYPAIGHGMVYPTMGLVNEAGEVAGKVKKIFRDHGGILSDTHKEDISKELGDVLWYVSQVAAEINVSLSEIASENIKKLQSRKKRGALKGDGDNR